MLRRVRSLAMVQQRCRRMPPGTTRRGRRPRGHARHHRRIHADWRRPHHDAPRPPVRSVQGRRPCGSGAPRGAIRPSAWRCWGTGRAHRAGGELGARRGRSGGGTVASGSGGRVRTGDLRVMSPARCLLRYPADEHHGDKAGRGTLDLDTFGLGTSTPREPPGPCLFRPGATPEPQRAAIAGQPCSHGGLPGSRTPLPLGAADLQSAAVTSAARNPKRGPPAKVARIPFNPVRSQPEGCRRMLPHQPVPAAPTPLRDRARCSASCPSRHDVSQKRSG